MKRFIFLGILVAFNTVNAQQLKQPQPGNTLPAPKLTVMKPADIEISQVELIKAEPIAGTKLHTIHVRVSIRNNGQMNTGTFMIQPFIENQLAAPQNARKKFGSTMSIQPIDGGKTMTVELTFAETERVVLSKRIKFFLSADYGNRVKESIESNNSTTGILIGL